MKQVNKRGLKLILWVLIITAIFFVTAGSQVLAVVNQKMEFYVNDYAEVLSKQTSEYIVENAIQIQLESKAQVVVVTVNDLEGKTASEYAKEVFNKFSLGDENENNGVLLFYYAPKKEVEIVVGKGLKDKMGVMKQAQIKTENMEIHLKNNETDQAMESGFDAISKVLTKKYNIQIQTLNETSAIHKMSIMNPVLLLCSLGIIVITALAKILLSKKIHLVYSKVLFINIIYIMFVVIAIYSLSKNGLAMLVLFVLSSIVLFFPRNNEKNDKTAVDRKKEEMIDHMETDEIDEINKKEEITKTEKGEETKEEVRIEKKNWFTSKKGKH